LNSLLERIEQVREKIKKSAAKGGNPPEQIKLVVVTKTVCADVVKQAIECDVQDVGENRIQDFLEKQKSINKKVNWHFIGHLQSNKVKFLINNVSLIHSLDRESLANEINKQGKLANYKFNCLVQVNVSGEASKFGISPENVEDFLVKLSGMEYINVQGLMTMAPFEDDTEDTRYVFERLRNLKFKLEGLDIPRIELKYLSMGMSNDYQVALEEGSNMVRIGSEIFGHIGGNNYEKVLV